MRTPFVIDACTLINLLRIDEEDNFLFKYLKSLDIHIAGTVYNEIKLNIFKNAISNEDIKRLKPLLTQIPTDFKFHTDEDIINDLNTEDYNSLLKYTGYDKKRFNGELISSILALVLSRSEETKICFLTDDFPAKKDFKNFFAIQQIGLIEDSVDLLLMLYWEISDFSISQLETKLLDLKAEYNRTQFSFVKAIAELKYSFKRGDTIRDNIEQIEFYFYKQQDIQRYKSCLRAIENVHNKVIKKCLSFFPNLSKQPELVEKIDLVLCELRKMKIYKLV